VTDHEHNWYGTVCLVCGCRSITITVPGRPPTPNARRHWRVTALDNDTWKGAARVVALEAKPDSWEPLDHAEVDVTFIVPDKRRRDLDNLVSSVKPQMDGIVDAGILRDDSLEVLSVVRYGWRYSKGESATEYVIREAA
jgi:crossover junction endodeoxyribonuclease RusA